MHIQAAEEHFDRARTAADGGQLLPVLAMVQRVSATTSTASKTAGISVPISAMAHSTLKTAYTDSKTATISVPVSAMAQGS